MIETLNYRYRIKKIIRVIVVLFSALFLVAIFAYVIKIDNYYKRQLALSFSVDSGLYNEPFMLEIRSNVDGTIYYTLDSSDPNENSFVYKNPIYIDDVSHHDNVYSEIMDIFFPQWYIDKLPEWISRCDIVTPLKKVDKCTVIKAMVVDSKGRQSEIFTNVYFIGFNEKKAYWCSNIISIVTDPNNLFDYNNGIYTTGKLFDDYIIKKQYSYQSGYETDMLADANYQGRGIEWEREVQVFCFENDNVHNNIVLEDGVYGIRVHGGITRSYNPKSLNIYSKSGDGREYTLLADKFTDYIVNKLCQSLAFDTREHVPVALFIDGEYWGNYYLVQKYNAEYFHRKYSVAGDDIVEIKLGDIIEELGGYEGGKEYRQLREYIVENDMSYEGNYDYVCSKIDIESFIDYYATEIYICNFDWPYSNAAFWKTRTVMHSNEYNDGKWRCILYDVDNALIASQANTDYTKRTAQLDDVFCSLMYNEKFYTKLCNKLVYLAENIFNPANTEKVINDFENEMRDALYNGQERYSKNNEIPDEDQISSMCDNYRMFFRMRYDYIISKYGKV